MSNEGAAEEIVEAGLELINPGGRPDVLRDAAKGWREMGENLTSTFKALNTQVENVLGEHWRGESADAFAAHWRKLREGIDETLPTFTEAAKGLDEAADAIEQVNEEIHAIYVEIGVSIAIGAGLSFVTMGFGGAAAAANAARLAAQAARICARLGTILTRIATAFRRIVELARTHKFLTHVAVNWAGNTGGSLAAKGYSGDSVSGGDVWEATWQGGVGAVVGTGAGLGVTEKLAGRLDGAAGRILPGVAGGATGNVVGGVAVDGISAPIYNTNDDPDDDVSWGSAGTNAAVNAIGGAAGGAGMAGVDRLNAPTRDLETPPDFTPLRPDRSGPHMSIDAPVGGVAAGVTGAVKEGLTGESGNDESPKTQTQNSSQQGNVRDVFG